MVGDYIFRLADNSDDLLQILSLQSENLKSNLTQVEMKDQGFVTLEHDFETLRKMNSPYPHIVAEYDGKIVGYTLVMLESMCQEVPDLQPMFDQINQTKYKSGYLADLNYFIMGQVCVSKEHRGKEVFASLYETLKASMSPFFDYIITEINVKNTRSSKAHQKIGFEIMHQYREDEETEWLIVGLKI